MYGDLFADITPAKALGISVSAYAEGRIELTASLQPNLNDKGTAFAGSQSALLTLTGWGVLTLALQQAGLSVDVMAVKSATEYRVAVQADMRSETILSPEERNRMVEELNVRGRSRMALEIILHAQEDQCAVMTAHYAIILHK